MIFGEGRSGIGESGRRRAIHGIGLSRRGHGTVTFLFDAGGTASRVMARWKCSYGTQRADRTNFKRDLQLMLGTGERLSSHNWGIIRGDGSVGRSRGQYDDSSRWFALGWGARVLFHARHRVELRGGFQSNSLFVKFHFATYRIRRHLWWSPIQ